MENRNLQVNTDSEGRIQTSDEELNAIIRAVEEESGAKLGVAVPAITFFGDDPDSKVYLLLLLTNDEDGEDRDWAVMIGRQNTYNYLKNLIEAEAIDPNTSFILSGNQKCEDAITIFRFMKICIENTKVLDDSGFDINDWAQSEEVPDKTILDV